MSDDLAVSKDGAIVEILLNRPKKKNALTHAMYEGLVAALANAETDSASRVVLVHGAGGTFSAGNDLLDFMSSPPTDESAPVLRFLRALSSFPKPFVAAVEGVAIGLGATMLLHADFVVAHAHAKLSFPFVPLGLVPEAASSYLLPRLVGHLRASELLLLGEPIDASRALELGLVTRLDANPLEHARNTARRLATLPPEALMETKRLLRHHTGALVREHIGEEARSFQKRLLSAEFAAQATKFFENRR